jgi:type II secretory pathway component PulC
MFEEIIAPLLTTEWSRRSGLIAIAVFSLFLCITLVKIPLAWHSDYVLAHTQTITKTTQPFADQTMAFILQLPNQHLFGASETTHLPITSLQLHLVGIIQADSENASRVIISEANQPGKIYQIGDSLLSGVRIKAITANSVILENGGHIEKLPLSRPPLTFEEMPKNIFGEKGAN